jgi:L-ascorbate metabolism protein UlaG (beta-lactamase superfamily)
VTATLDLAWLGHATADVRLGPTRILTDPVLRDAFAHLVRYAGVNAPEPGKVDAVLVSHLHHDHLDVPSLRRFGPDTAVVVPFGAGRFAARALGREVTELRRDDSLRVGTATVTAVPAVHQPSRWPGLVRAEPLGYVIDDGAHVVYFAGDTALYDAMRDLPAPDVALLPIWGWGPNLGPGHLDPRGAAVAASRVGARVVVPVHWGTFAPRSLRHRAPTWLAQPAPEFVAAMAQCAPRCEARVVTPGSAPIRFAGATP